MVGGKPADTPIGFPGKRHRNAGYVHRRVPDKALTSATQRKPNACHLPGSQCFTVRATSRNSKQSHLLLSLPAQKQQHGSIVV